VLTTDNLNEELRFDPEDLDSDNMLGTCRCAPGSTTLGSLFPETSGNAAFLFEFTDNFVDAAVSRSAMAEWMPSWVEPLALWSNFRTHQIRVGSMSEVCRECFDKFKDADPNIPWTTTPQPYRVSTSNTDVNNIGNRLLMTAKLTAFLSGDGFDASNCADAGHHSAASSHSVDCRCTSSNCRMIYDNLVNNMREQLTYNCLEGNDIRDSSRPGGSILFSVNCSTQTEYAAKFRELNEIGQGDLQAVHEIRFSRTNVEQIFLDTFGQSLDVGSRHMDDRIPHFGEQSISRQYFLDRFSETDFCNVIECVEVNEWSNLQIGLTAVSFAGGYLTIVRVVLSIIYSIFGFLDGSPENQQFE
jgi:hypothetical protein